MPRKKVITWGSLIDRPHPPLHNNDPVVLACWYELHPTYHKAKDYLGSNAAPLTRCGRTLSPFAPTVRFDLAVVAGRPCRQCFKADHER